MLEVSPPSDLQAVRALYNYLQTCSAEGGGLGADSDDEDPLDPTFYLRALHVPVPIPQMLSTSGAIELGSVTQARRWQLAATASSTYLSPPVYAQGEKFLQGTDRTPNHPPSVPLLHFMFRHGRIAEACARVLQLRSQPTSCMVGDGGAEAETSAENNAEKRVVEELCKLCVTFGAMKHLQHALLTLQRQAAVAASPQLNQGVAAMMRAVSGYFFEHCHLHHLHRVLQALRDHAAAGLTCVQLFLCTGEGELEQALSHLANCLLPICAELFSSATPLLSRRV